MLCIKNNEETGELNQKLQKSITKSLMKLLDLMKKKLQGGKGKRL